MPLQAAAVSLLLLLQSLPLVAVIYTVVLFDRTYTPHLDTSRQPTRHRRSCSSLFKDQTGKDHQIRMLARRIQVSSRAEGQTLEVDITETKRNYALPALLARPPACILLVSPALASSQLSTLSVTLRGKVREQSNEARS